MTFSHMLVVRNATLLCTRFPLGIETRPAVAGILSDIRVRVCLGAGTETAGGDPSASFFFPLSTGSFLLA